MSVEEDVRTGGPDLRCVCASTPPNPHPPPPDLPARHAPAHCFYQHGKKASGYFVCIAATCPRQPPNFVAYVAPSRPFFRGRAVITSRSPLSS
jgi:hypothetical protein